MNLSEEDIQRIVNQQQDNQNIEQSLEQLLAQLILNPARLKTIKKKLTNFNGNSVTIAQSKEGSLISPEGFPEEKNEEDAFLLDDGTSLCGITVCQTCGGVVKEENIRRCKCGRTTCVRHGCGRVSRNGNWYCSLWHKLLGELGFNLR